VTVCAVAGVIAIKHTESATDMHPLRLRIIGFPWERLGMPARSPLPPGNRRNYQEPNSGIVRDLAWPHAVSRANSRLLDSKAGVARQDEETCNYRLLADPPTVGLSDEIAAGAIFRALIALPARPFPNFRNSSPFPRKPPVVVKRLFSIAVPFEYVAVTKILLPFVNYTLPVGDGRPLAAVPRRFRVTF